MASLLDNIARPSAVILQLSVVLGVIFVLLKVAQFCKERKKLIKALEAFPGPPKHWLYGHNHLLNTTKILNQIVSWGEEYPYAFPRWLGPVLPSLVIHHPEYAKSIFGQTDSKSDVPYKFLVPWIGQGLLNLEGTKWFQHRKLLTPAFHYDVLKSYVALMSESVKVMLDKWEKKNTERKSVEIFQDISLMTLDSIMKCAFSCNTNCQTQRSVPKLSNSGKANYYIRAVYDLSYLISNRIQTFSYKDVFYDLTYKGREFRDACKLAHTHTDKVIKERKRLLSNEKELDKIQKKRHLDFLDILLCTKDANGVGLSDEDLRAEVDTFMFAGHDTTASGISWLFYCLSLHPEYQQRCREEIQGILGDRDTIEWEDLGKMTYTTMCIKESLRLFPPVPSVSRYLSKPVTFPDGRSLPAGCQVGVNIFAIHRNRDVWEDPEIYDPLRFSPENSAQRHSHAFMPFSAGSRNCIGQQFAMNEIKVALALTLLCFELCPNPSMPPTPIQQLILKSRNGFHLHLKKIH
ncbi:PREDICTED: cytochrome P450 4B1-like [Haliaeetus leucocephalus]|uniref:cytochrome P450 4B1-like n=1 Tax=Haliaeetus leucocephalus TaxID=52644 RepID=UPI00053CAB21|nr:PREDICTED: cytochrome P450 4B1-like [Haliaeetus leucocephalus]